jgi:hypothetical protein
METVAIRRRWKKNHGTKPQGHRLAQTGTDLPQFFLS